MLWSWLTVADKSIGVIFYSRHSLSSLCSDDDEEEEEARALSESAASTLFPSALSSYLSLVPACEDVDEGWKRHVTRVMSEASVTNTIYTSHIFPKLYKVGLRFLSLCAFSTWDENVLFYWRFMFFYMRFKIFFSSLGGFLCEI